MTRPRDYSFEALAEVTSTDPAAGRGELNVALKSIRAQEPEITDSYLLADEIHTRAKMYRQVMPEAMLTPTALCKHWKRVKEEMARKRAGANRSAPEADPVDGKRGIAAPEWFYVWRYARKRGDFRPLPQQAQYVDPTKVITDTEYAELRAAWIAAGSPKASLPELATASVP